MFSKYGSLILCTLPSDVKLTVFQSFLFLVALNCVTCTVSNSKSNHNANSLATKNRKFSVNTKVGKFLGYISLLKVA